MLCDFHNFVDAKARRVEKPILTVKFYQADHDNFINHHQKVVYFKSRTPLSKRAPMQNFIKNVSIRWVLKNL